MKITINEETIPEGVCRQHMEMLRRESPKISEEELKKKAADMIIRQVLIRNESKKMFPSVPDSMVENEFLRFRQNFRTNEEFQGMCRQANVTEELIREDIRSSVRGNLFLNDLLKFLPAPPPQILEEYYKRDPEVSMRPLEVHAAHIVKKPDPQNPLKTYEEMCGIRKQLLVGAKFAEIADKHSSCKDKGGDLGYFSRGKMVEEFEVVIFSMNRGEISPVFQTPFGYHIAIVYDIRQPSQLSFEECKDAVRAKVIERLREQTIAEWVEKERAKAKISVME